MSRKTKYSDVQRANTLALLKANGGNASQTARDTGIPRRTIQHWRKGELHPSVATIAQEKSLSLTQLFENAARNALDAADSKRDAASYRDLMTGAGIAADKVAALSGSNKPEGQNTQVSVFIQTHLGGDGMLPEF